MEGGKGTLLFSEKIWIVVRLSRVMLHCLGSGVRELSLVLMWLWAEYTFLKIVKICIYQLFVNLP